MYIMYEYGEILKKIQAILDSNISDEVAVIKICEVLYKAGLVSLDWTSSHALGVATAGLKKLTIPGPVQSAVLPIGMYRVRKQER